MGNLYETIMSQASEMMKVQRLSFKEYSASKWYWKRPTSQADDDIV